MAPNRRRLLDALYAQVPGIDCRGLCWGSCGPIEMSSAERRRIAAAGYDIPPATPEMLAGDRPIYCPALGAGRRCAVYDIRPMICRLWGVSVDMPCMHGCRPGRYLTREESMGLLAAASDAAGDPYVSAGVDKSPAQFMALMRSPLGRAATDIAAERGRRGDRRRMLNQDVEGP